MHEPGNFRAPPDDNACVNCSDIREAISSRLDGEPAGPAGTLVADHLATCIECQHFETSALQLHRTIRLRPAEVVPDLTDAILAAAPMHGYRVAARYALLVVSLTMLVLALPALVLGTDSGASAHIARHIGSFDVTIAVGLVAAAWRPQRARPFLPVAAALALCMGITSVIDLVDGSARIYAESYHVLDLIGLLLVWALAGFPLPRLDRSVLRFAA